MAMNSDSAENLVKQLQSAHRISVAFYRRMLPTLDFIASQLNCEFNCWEPLHTAVPPRRMSKPSATWAWDYVPLFASNHIYVRTNGEHAQPSDIGLCLCLYIDYGFTPEERKKKGVSGEPDPVTLPIGKAVLQAWVYRPIECSESSFDELWSETPDPVLGVDYMQHVAENLKAIAIEWPLAEVIQDVAPIIETLKAHTA